MTHAKGVLIFIRGACERAAGHGQMQTIMAGTHGGVPLFWMNALPRSSHLVRRLPGRHLAGSNYRRNWRPSVTATERVSAEMAKPRAMRGVSLAGCPLAGGQANNLGLGGSRRGGIHPKERNPTVKNARLSTAPKRLITDPFPI